MRQKARCAKRAIATYEWCQPRTFRTKKDPSAFFLFTKKDPCAALPCLVAVLARGRSRTHAAGARAGLGENSCPARLARFWVDEAPKLARVVRHHRTASAFASVMSTRIKRAFL